MVGKVNQIPTPSILILGLNSRAVYGVSGGKLHSGPHLLQRSICSTTLTSSVQQMFDKSHNSSQQSKPAMAAVIILLSPI